MFKSINVGILETCLDINSFLNKYILKTCTYNYGGLANVDHLRNPFWKYVFST